MESLTIEMDGTGMAFSIYDFTGRRMRVPVREKGNAKVILDVSGLANGTYLVRVGGSIGKARVLIAK